MKLSGFQLKYIAILTMTIDHIGAILLPVSSPAYNIARLIGRLAFPIFCFLLTEGYFHTSNHSAYIKRLLLFALISELPFDMALFHFPQVHDVSVLFGHQNVYFTLALGMVTLCLMDRLLQKEPTGAFLIALASGLIGEFLNFDYGASGILLILILYGAKRFHPGEDIFFFYSGKRGNPLPGKKSFPGTKYLFYAYYPVHLFILSIIYMLIQNKA